MSDEKAMPSVLVVEDEWLIAEYLQDALESAGYNVKGPASHVKDALAIIEQSVVDAAILDVSLHTERSFPIAHILAARSIPFAFMTGYVASDMPDDLKGRPILSKPVQASELVAYVGRLLVEGGIARS